MMRAEVSMSEPAWVTEDQKKELARNRRRVGRLKGKTVAAVKLDGNEDALTITCTDGTSLVLDTGVTNSHRSRIWSRWKRLRRR